MKKFYSVVIGLLLIGNVTAQAPNKMSYQAVVRDASNSLVTSQPVGMQISILQGSVSGTPVYEEIQNPTTNANGLVSIEIGSGTIISGDFNTINWSAGPYFIKTETDPSGGSTYTITGTSQLMSVPYALYSKTAENVTNDLVEDADSDPTNEMNTGVILNGTDLEITDANGTIIADLSALQDGVVDADADSTNEMNTSVVLNGTDLEITDGNGTIVTDLSSLQDGVNDADADPSNELQNLTISNDTIFLSNGGFVKQADPVTESTGSLSSICSGSSAPGVGWQVYDANTIYLQVNTGGCNYTTTPRYFTSIGGVGSHFELIGVNAIYSSTSTGFTVYVQKNSLTALTPTDALIGQWFINWHAIGN
ncbi:hypothetical protein OAW23_05805 [Flavobacteriales bacterium]|nr:hypothetical protein [Flavobacteriales bacterium]